MNVHEYQAKALFREFGVAVPSGELATTPEEFAIVEFDEGWGLLTRRWGHATQVEGPKSKVEGRSWLRA